MLKRLWAFILGYYVLSVPRGMRAQVYDRLFREGVEFFGERNSRKGMLTLSVTRKYRGVLRHLVDEFESSGVCISPLRGVPVLLRFFLHRPGFILGFAVFAVWSFYSQRIIWDIRIEGNSIVPDSEIIELLTELGSGYGAWYPSVEYDDVHAEYVARSDNIGWISVYVNGTVAEVQVREIVKDDRVFPEEGVYANVVASEDGEIEIVRVFEGQSAVKIGQVVRKGEVVISGVMDRKVMNVPEGGIRLEYAKGEVMAKTVRTVDVEISRKREEKIYTGAETVRKSIKIFGNVVKLFKNTGITYRKYDKIDRIERLSLFGICSLPVWISETVYREYTYEIKEIPAEQAVNEGLAELRRLTDEALVDGELLSKTISSELYDGGYRIRCVLYIRRDIAETVEFRKESIP